MRGGRLIRTPAYVRRNWPVRLAVCAMFRNEARYVAEWLAFHRHQGVERFYLYDNTSSDDWRAAIEPHAGVVSVQSWPGPPEAQRSAYADCLGAHRFDTRWIAFIDLDEFLYSPTGRTLPDVLREFPRAPGVAVNLRCYGTSGHEQAPPGGVLASYSWRGEDGFHLNRHVKTIAFPLMTSTFVQNPHHFRHYGQSVGERHDVVTSPYRDPATVDLLRINHYYTRSLSEYREKVVRPRADTNEPREWIDPPVLNAVQDPMSAALIGS